MTLKSTPERTRITTIENEHRGLKVNWADSHVSQFPAIALRVNCECEVCGSYRTALRNCRLTDIPATVEISDARVLGDTVEITWKHDNHESRFSAEWLRANCNSPPERERRR